MTLIIYNCMCKYYKLDAKIKSKKVFFSELSIEFYKESFKLNLHSCWNKMLSIEYHKYSLKRHNLLTVTLLYLVWMFNWNNGIFLRTKQSYSFRNAYCTKVQNIFKLVYSLKVFLYLFTKPNKTFYTESLGIC